MVAIIIGKPDVAGIVFQVPNINFYEKNKASITVLGYAEDLRYDPTIKEIVMSAFWQAELFAAQNLYNAIMTENCEAICIAYKI
jgi:hypothetical protein